MPSFCIVESCKLAKQIGDKISYHKFPFNNIAVFEKWIEFLKSSQPYDPTKKSKDKKITRYSSICSRHFTATDFKDCRLKKTAFPTVLPQKPAAVVVERKNEDEEIVELGTEDPLGSDVCSLCQNGKNQQYLPIDDFYIALISKCLPFTIQFSFLHKLCTDCAQHLTTFSLFIDKIILAQNQMLPVAVENVTTDNSFPAAPSVRKIKVEPISSFEQEEKLPSIQVIDFVHQQKSQQQKCEILEIVDIKPFSFDGNLQHELPEDDEIQILSPKQLKVELTDHDEENEVSSILSIFRQEHNYVRNDVIEVAEPNVKTERIEDESSLPSRPSKICSSCNRSFSTIRKYLVHKISQHPRSKTTRRKLHQTSYQSLGSRNAIRKKENSIPRPGHEKSFQCPDCPKSFSGSKNLYQHSMSHKATVYACHVCEKKFKRKHGLTQHVKSIHEQEKTQVCPVCNYRYLLKADMLRCRHSKLKRQQPPRTYILSR